MADKQLGYALLGLGIFVMLGALVYLFLVVMGVIPPIPLFNSLGDLSGLLGALQNPYAISPNQNGTTVTPNMMDPDLLAEVLNITTTLFLMGFVMSFGYKLSSLGVQLIRPVYVKMKNADVDATKPSTPKMRLDSI